MGVVSSGLLAGNELLFLGEYKLEKGLAYVLAIQEPLGKGHSFLFYDLDTLELFRERAVLQESLQVERLFERVVTVVNAGMERMESELAEISEIQGGRLGRRGREALDVKLNELTSRRVGDYNKNLGPYGNEHFARAGIRPEIG